MRHTWTLLILFSGCTTKVTTVVPVMGELDESTPSSVSVESAVGLVGSGTVEVPIRLINDYGAAVPGGNATIRVDGPTATLGATSVPFDGSGFASAAVSTSTPEAFTVTVDGTDMGVTGGISSTSYAVSGNLPALQVDQAELLPSGAQNPDFIAEGTGGLAVATGDMVYWVPATPGQPAYVVATLPFDVAGMWATHIDSDGILDVVLWGADEAVFLRGHDGGGYAWGGAWQADSGTVVGVSANDFNGDRLTDLAVGITGDVTSTVQILTGDGAWGFQPTAVLDQDITIMGVAAADEGHDGTPDVTSLASTSGHLRRYTLTSDGWVGATGGEIGAGYLDDLGGSVGAQLFPETDLDADGDYDFVLVGPPGTNQDFIFATISDGVTYYNLTFNQAHVALADLDGVAPVEMVVLDQDGLNIIAYQGATADPLFQRRTISLDGSLGPIAFLDTNGDGVRDALVATDTIDIFAGSLGDNGWTDQTWTWRSYAANISGPIVYGDFNGDGFLDLASLSDASGKVSLTMWTFGVSGTDIRLGSGDAVDLGDISAESLDVCQEGGDYIFYAISSASTTNTLHRVRFDPSAQSLTEEASVAVGGPYVGCGDFAPGDVAVANAAGTWVSYTYSASALTATTNTDSIGPIYAATSADTNGDGYAELVGCDTSGCSVAAGDTNGDGKDEVVTGGTSVALLLDGESLSLQGTGQVSLADVDGDGLLDVLAVDASAGKIYVYRSVAGGVAPPVVLHTTRAIDGPATLADVNGDGVPELVLEGGDGSIVHTAVTPAG